MQRASKWTKPLAVTARGAGDLCTQFSYCLCGFSPLCLTGVTLLRSVLALLVRPVLLLLSFSEQCSVQLTFFMDTAIC